jgi:hypothetical protein
MSHQGWLAKLQGYKESLAGLFHHICLSYQEKILQH